MISLDMINGKPVRLVKTAGTSDPDQLGNSLLGKSAHPVTRQ